MAIRLAHVSRKQLSNIKAMTTPIYNYEGKVIGENVDGKINWYYSDGSAGGENGGHYMDTIEFLRYNGFL